MYLDDGVSRSSAPTGLPQYGSDDSEAKGEYREVKISHVMPFPSSIPHPFQLLQI
tara:strand:- start:1083 stop:1247 length:165 start_codon:yes stop_codon:yes gene_type:complete